MSILCGPQFPRVRSYSGKQAFPRLDRFPPTNESSSHGPTDPQHVVVYVPEKGKQPSAYYRPVFELNIKFHQETRAPKISLLCSLILFDIN